MSLTLQPVRVANGFDEDGMLVFSDGRLEAVLVRLSDENEIAPGDWFLEAGFGWVGNHDHPTFLDLDAAQDWIVKRIGPALTSA